MATSQTGMNLDAIALAAENLYLLRSNSGYIADADREPTEVGFAGTGAASAAVVCVRHGD